MEKKIKTASHTYICDKCKGNGYIKINDMIAYVYKDPFSLVYIFG